MKEFKSGKKTGKISNYPADRDEKTVDNHLKRFNKEYFPITVEEHLSLLKEYWIQSGGAFLVFLYAGRVLCN